jgi:hypothetical protein
MIAREKLEYLSGIFLYLAARWGHGELLDGGAADLHASERDAQAQLLNLNIEITASPGVIMRKVDPPKI